MRLAIILLLALFGCAPSGPHAYQGQAAVTVRAPGYDWSAEEQAEIGTELHTLSTAYGIQFVLSELHDATVTIRREDKPGTDAAGHAGYGAAEIYINTLALPHSQYALKLRTIVGHELGHWLGMDHLCEHEASYPTTVCWEPGYAWNGLMSRTATTDTPTAADVALFNLQVRDVWAVKN